MDHIRVGRVCLLLLVIAAALPVIALAQSPAADASSTSGNDATDQTVSNSQVSESSKADTISAESLSKRNIGLKPISSSKQAASQTGSAQSSATSTDSGATESAASESVTADTATTESVTADTATTESATADTATTESATADTATTESATADTATTESATADTATTESATADTATTESATADTATTESATADTATTESATADTATTESVTPDTITTESNATDDTPATDNTTTSAQESSVDNASENASVGELPPEEDIQAEEEEVTKNRIWREGDPEHYTWDYRIFSGFFYDMENNVGTEKLTIDLDGNNRKIDEGNLKYTTEAETLDYEFGDWGSYQVIGFMAEKYFAGYIETEGEDTLFGQNFSLLNEGQLRKVLVDTDEESTIQTGSVLSLEEGYELQIKQIDIDGNKVYLGLSKDGEEIDSKVVSPEGSLKSATYEYKVDISGEDVPIIMAHISNVFASTESDLVTVDGLFQLSDTYTSVENGDDYDKMQVTAVSDEGVEMENEDSLTLRKGSTTKIFGDVGFIVADADVLRFAPVVERSGPQEVRGTVINPSEDEEFTWTVYNFEGFYYDIDDDIGTETLTAKISGGTKINDGDLTYSTSPSAVDFEYEDWGKYDVIGFMAGKYFAGYNNETKFADEVSCINEGELRKVLIDDDTSQTIASGSVLSLEEGYDLRIKQVDINGNKVYLALAKDGEEVDSKVVTPSGDATDRSSSYLYKVDIGSEKDVPIIAVHVESVFKSTESDLATIDAIFQVSDSPESVEEGEVHGKMKVESLGDDGIEMKNDNSISLSRDKTIEIMDNLKLRVADSDERLTAPVAIKNDENADMTLSIPSAVVDTPVTMTVKYGIDALAGVKITLDSSPIGTTDATGSLSYTPTETGNFSVLAKLTGYNDAKGSLVVRTAEEAGNIAAIEESAGKLTFNAPTEVIKGENFLITVVEGANQTPVDSASIYLDDESIGNTGSQGSLTYAANITGEHTLKAEKEGFIAASQKITIVSSLKVTGLVMPDKAYAGSEMKVSATVENTGSNADARQLDLLVNESIAGSKNVSLKGGENSTISFSYKPNQTGLTRFSIDEQSKSINVEQAESKTWLIALILVILIAIGAGYYLYSKGELDNLQKQVKNMMQRR